MKNILLLIAVSILPTYTFALSGKVVRVSDGDTLVILTNEKKQIKVRLRDIDAPEKKQAFGNKSTQTLKAICANKIATLTDIDKDRYKRTLARVHCGTINANAFMVGKGMAWVYDRYVTDHSLYKLQVSAKYHKLGLWADRSPIAPWIFRKLHR